MRIRNFIRDRKNICSFHFDKKSCEVKTEGDEQTFREKIRKIFKKIFDRNRMLCYNLNHVKYLLYIWREVIIKFSSRHFWRIIARIKIDVKTYEGGMFFMEKRIGNKGDKKILEVNFNKPLVLILKGG